MSTTLLLIVCSCVSTPVPPTLMKADGPKGGDLLNEKPTVLWFIVVAVVPMPFMGLYISCVCATCNIRNSKKPNAVQSPRRKSQMLVPRFCPPNGRVPLAAFPTPYGVRQRLAPIQSKRILPSRVKPRQCIPAGCTRSISRTGSLSATYLTYKYAPHRQCRQPTSLTKPRSPIRTSMGRTQAKQQQLLRRARSIGRMC